MRRSEAVAAAARAATRTRHHVARLGHALRHAGPGRIPGAVLGVSVHPDVVRVHGWAGQPGREVQQVWVTVGGVPLGAATLGLPTPTDQAGRPATTNSPTAGWSLELPRERFPLGEQHVGGLVLQGYGMVEAFDGPTVLVDQTGTYGNVEVPAAGADVGNIITVRGWVRVSLGVDRVEVRLADGPPVRARLLAQARPDLLPHLPDVDAGIAGWEATVRVLGDQRWYLDRDLTAHEPVDLELTVEAVRPSGRVVLGTVPVVHRAQPRTTQDERRARVIEARTAILARDHVPAAEGEHLLVVTHHLGLGGGQLYLQTLLRHLLRQDDVTCTVLCPVDGPLRDELEALGARVHVVGWPPDTAVAYEEWLHGVAAVAVRTGATSVVANTAGCFWGPDLADRLGIPSIWAVHESFAPEHFLEVGFRSRPDAWVTARFATAFAKASRVVFEADSTMDLFVHLIRDGRGLRVDYGIELDDIDAYRAANDRSEVRRSLGISPDQSVLLCMGTFEPRKAQGLLTAAFARASEDFPRAVLVMVGDNGGPFSDAVHELVRRLGVEDRVRLLPVTPDIAQWYLAADAMILASDIESLSRSMLESMAYGTPVIVSAVFGHTEVVEDGVTGFLIDSSSVSGTAAGMRRFLKLSREERSVVADNARRWVEERSSERYAGEYRHLIEQVRAETAAAEVVAR
ncbi:glycosyltransferase family 4 protein [Cellulomonas sp.]|uniref:glycosyltransferase family 4 protein n=1 Tax=Cellulomonas sp. TaxID=40001 RepID=UPI001B1BD892|nr:glycosyltransferase family 4 protein [Cellulomonas sp.]MBO9555745.1 glycosyltransferase family 4 protein [Cellulomonas sp.]